MIDALIRKFERRDELTPAEVARLAALQGETFEVRAGDDFVRIGQHVDQSILLISGMAGRYATTPDGRLQYSEVSVPGDFIDLHGFVLKQLDHGVRAFSDCRAFSVRHTELRTLTEQEPHLTRLLWLETVVDAAIHRRWILVLGSLDGPQKLAHLLCELYLRCAAVGVAWDNRLDLPLTQSDLGQVLGMSEVHVNRSLQRLRSEELIVWRSQEIKILQWDALVARGSFDPQYLRFQREAV